MRTRASSVEQLEPVEEHSTQEELAHPEGCRSPELASSLLRQVAQVELPLRTPQPGERLGGGTGSRFEILGKLGTGAMGQVFRAWDEELQRVVALKFLRSAASLAEERLLASMREEARAIARLNHENIVHVFDMAEWKSQSWEPAVPFLIMEHLEGECLEAILEQGRPTFRRALELMSAITAGLAHAHEHQIVHRDLKPSNVFILRQGKVKLIDFGLAHFTANSTPYLPTAGTPAYMAPEQWRGAAQDARTDVWAAGIMLYELLTGQFPYPMSTIAQLRARVTSLDPIAPLRQRQPELPQQVELLLSQALAKDPARRFPTAAELHAALTLLIGSLGPEREQPHALGPQRRQVTLVCCWLDDRSSPLQALDPEESSELEALFQRRCSELLQRHGGTIASCIGDQVLACFGHPLAREDDSEQAVRASLHLVAALHRELPHPSPTGFTVKVGIHTDFVVVDDTPTQARGGPAIQGEAPKLAEWLTRHAPADTVALSGTTWTLVRGAFVTEARPPLHYEGRTGPRELTVRRVVRERRAPLRFDRSRLGGRAPLVGRERELDQLKSSWATARSGRGAFVLVTGEAGIGKSRLLRELRQHVATGPHLRLQGQCWAQLQTSAFYPVVEMLQRLLCMAPQDAPSRRLSMLEQQLHALALEPEHVRLIATFLSLPVAEEASHPRLSPQFQKEKTFEALEALLRRLTEEHPVLAIVEDLHWADPSTLELLGFLFERLAGHRLFVLLSARPGFLAPWASSPGLQTITLDRLQADQTAALVREAAQGKHLSPEVLELLVAKTDGIPLFIEEMTHVVLERPCADPATASKALALIPSTLHELLLSRLDSLPAPQKALAQLCAVVGRSFDQALLLAISHRTEAALKRELAGLLDSGLLQQQDELAEPRYQFRHALIQEAASHSLPRRTRQQHHRRIVQVLAEQFPGVAETQPERLAHHYTEAGELRSAISWWDRAGERDSLRSANTEAVSHFTQALALVGHLPPSAERAHQELRLRIGLGLPLLQLRGYHSPEVEHTYERARVLLGELGDSVELPSWSFFHYYHATARLDLLLRIGEQFVDMGLRQNNPELLLLGHRTIAGAVSHQGNTARALRHIEQALACSDFDLGRHRELAAKHWVNLRVDVLSLGGVLYALAGRPDRSRECTQEALKLAHRLSHPHTLAYALAYATAASQFLREPRQAIEWADAGIAISAEHGFHLWLGWSALLRVWATSELGDTEQGLEIVRHGLEQLRSSGVRTLLPLLLGFLAEMHRRLGQTDEGLSAIQEAQAWTDATHQHCYEAEQHRLAGELLRQRGQQQEAEACLLRAITVASQQQAFLFELRATVSLSRQLQGQGRLEEAQQRLEASCARFAPELECVDLTEARELLAQLRARPGSPG